MSTPNFEFWIYQFSDNFFSKDWFTLIRTKCSCVSLLCLVQTNVYQSLRGWRFRLRTNFLDKKCQCNCIFYLKQPNLFKIGRFRIGCSHLTNKILQSIIALFQLVFSLLLFKKIPIKAQQLRQYTEEAKAIRLELSSLSEIDRTLPRECWNTVKLEP